MLNGFLNLKCVQEPIGLNLYPTEVDTLISAYYLEPSTRDYCNCLASDKSPRRRQEQTPQFVLFLL